MTKCNVINIKVAKTHSPVDVGSASGCLEKLVERPGLVSVHIGLA